MLRYVVQVRYFVLNRCVRYHVLLCYYARYVTFTLRYSELFCVIQVSCYAALRYIMFCYIKFVSYYGMLCLFVIFFLCFTQL